MKQSKTFSSSPAYGKGFFIILISCLLYSLNVYPRPTTNYSALWTPFKIIRPLFRSNKLKHTIDFQYRLNTETRYYNQTIIRNALSYRLAPNTSLSLGYDIINLKTTSHKKTVYEQRFWQQWMWKNTFSNDITFYWRSRIEDRNRFIEHQHNIRFRQKIVFFIKKFMITEEVFIPVNHPDWITKTKFDQNRVFLGFNLKQTKQLTWQIGYLNQIKFRIPKNKMYHIAMISAFYSLGS